MEAYSLLACAAIGAFFGWNYSAKYCRPLALRYWWARFRSGYGPIRLQLLTEGTLTVSVFKQGKWIPVIAEFRDTNGCTIDHSVSEIEIHSLMKRPFYFEHEGDTGHYKRRSRISRRRRNP